MLADSQWVIACFHCDIFNILTAHTVHVSDHLSPLTLSLLDQPKPGPMVILLGLNTTRRVCILLVKPRASGQERVNTVMA